ncbi:MAG: YlmC/YmxH family sporulation protein [Lachnospiraceae bacterium]|nr:YlmC/YmxH family sporulation protein [Lachnospiraceae bacterium]
MRVCDLKYKEVINEKDCTRLGNVCDVEFNQKTGCIEAFIVPGPAKLCGFFGRDAEYIIPYKNVCQIGDDIILVCIDDKCLAKKRDLKDKMRDNFFGF